MRPQAFSGNRFRVRHQLGQRARGHDFTAVHARAGPQVNDVVRPPHGGFVVLHHEHRVAAGLEFVQRRQQLLVIARVQANGGLIKDIEHAAQVGSQLRRQPDALRLAARKRRHAPPKLQVVQPHLPEELQAFSNLRQDVPRNQRGARGKPDVPEEMIRLRNRHLAERVNRGRPLPLRTPHSALRTPQCRRASPLRTPHSALRTPQCRRASPLRTPHSALRTPQSHRPRQRIEPCPAALGAGLPLPLLPAVP